jgi:hypothetical protein
VPIFIDRGAPNFKHLAERFGLRRSPRKHHGSSERAAFGQIVARPLPVGVNRPSDSAVAAVLSVPPLAAEAMRYLPLAGVGGYVAAMPLALLLA